jgi:hypothetical protein
MRPIDEIIRETYEQNRRTFSDEDRINARIALNTFMCEINGAGLRWMFDYGPRNIDRLLARSQRHCSEIDCLETRAKEFEVFIELIEKLGERAAVQLNPMWYSADDAPETITRTLDPLAVPTYRAFHAALVVYLDELGKENPNWSKVADLARQVAYTVKADEWRKAGATTSERGVANFGTRWFLEAILAKS